jgi:cephalosporin hydroxylase
MSFQDEILERLYSYDGNVELKNASSAFIHQSIINKYSYNFSYLGRPIIQYPQDMVAMQELIWSVRPDLIIETGIAHGGSLIMNASILALLDHCDALENNELIDPKNPTRRAIGIDIDIREHNRKAIENHPMSNRIDMIQGSSISKNVIQNVRNISEGYSKIMICLDSNHTHDHVLSELKAYAPLTSIGSYCVVFDTIIDDLPNNTFTDRPWSKGNNPKTAVKEYLKMHTEFEVDKKIDSKLLISVAPNGYLKRIS